MPHIYCSNGFARADCWPSVEYLIQLVTERDELLADAINNLYKSCEDFETEDTCISAR